MAFALRLIYSQFIVKVPKPTTSFQGKTIIITGGNTGLGFEAAKYYPKLKASRVILACRSLEKADKAKLELEQTFAISGDIVETWQLDLSSYASVIEFCEKAKTLPRLDVMLLNAGILTKEYRVAEDNESTITVNVISTFLMAFLLMPKLKETAKYFGTTPHMTVVSSDLHFLSDFAEWKSDDIFESLNDKGTARMNDRYNLSKLMEILIVRHFVSLHGTDYPVVFNTVHPGWCQPNLANEIATIFLKKVENCMGRTTEEGARSLVFATSFGKESHGKYVGNGGLLSESSFVTSKDGAAAGEKLWTQLSIKLEKIRPNVRQGC
ncbi:uncharacterized protein EAE97_009346 [Botrytis byssoidea]|uniref:Ketoreductase (KR) domain-containing protein n=1 Tax=Botrytis byssoidea TaxID=139641 RepID=A0A9P5I3U0_9HELO|nr:uncharacterized protein EAE97_009346 [Botrytis byssoidea]KAF7931137.1 hypothetical protein EAE97_009346 [Botrytis byssoidea]